MLFLKETQKTDSIHNEASTFQDNVGKDNFAAKASLSWRKLYQSQGKVERRSSDVTLEKMHAGDRRENETICASLKKYQTLPPKVALDSLVSFWKSALLLWVLIWIVTLVYLLII